VTHCKAIGNAIIKILNKLEMKYLKQEMNDGIYSIALRENPYFDIAGTR